MYHMCVYIYIYICVYIYIYICIYICLLLIASWQLEDLVLLTPYLIAGKVNWMWTNGGQHQWGRCESNGF